MFDHVNSFFSFVVERAVLFAKKLTLDFRFCKTWLKANFISKSSGWMRLALFGITNCFLRRGCYVRKAVVDFYV